MNNQEDRLKKYLQEIPQDSPSEDFTLSIMQQLEQKSVIKSHEPLMGRSAWFVFIILVLSVVFGLYIFSAQEMPMLSIQPEMRINWQLNWQFGPSVMAGVVFGILFWVQLIIIRQRYLYSPNGLLTLR